MKRSVTVLLAQEGSKVFKGDFDIWSKDAIIDLHSAIGKRIERKAGDIKKCKLKEIDGLLNLLVKVEIDISNEILKGAQDATRIGIH